MEGVMKSDDNDMSASEYNNRQKLEGQFKVLGSTSTYSVVQPLTFEAERYFGSGTEWCTVANKDYFDRYTERGSLFIIYPKDGDKKRKMQFHFESESFADYEDEVYEEPLECMKDVVHDDNELSELTKLCKNIWKDKANYFMTFEEYLTIAIQRLSDGESPYDIFDYVGSFREGFALVVLRGKYNFINQKGDILSPNQWFDNAYSFHEGFARVYLHGKGYNFINQKGDILSPNQWFDDADDFSEGFACVNLNGDSYYIDTEGKLYDEDNNFIRNLRESVSGRSIDMIIESTLRKYLRK